MPRTYLLNPSGHCAKCGQWFAMVEMDHIIPLSAGGQHTVANLQWLCTACHIEKSRSEISNFNKGKKLSPEHRQKLSTAHKGMKHSGNTRRNMTASHKKYWDTITAEERAERGRRTSQGKQKHRRETPMIEFRCKHCDKTFVRPIWRTYDPARTNEFCSRACHYAFVREHPRPKA